jgi:hypothetical protein
MPRPVAPDSADPLHDLNNLLTVVLWNLEILTRAPGPADPLPLRRARDGALAASALLLQLSGSPPSDLA